VTTTNNIKEIISKLKKEQAEKPTYDQWNMSSSRPKDEEVKQEFTSVKDILNKVKKDMER